MVPSTSIATAHQLPPTIRSSRTDSHLTIPLSSPGRAASRSPTCTIPLSIRPEMARPEATALCPRKTFEMGILSGASSARGGTSSRSIGILQQRPVNLMRRTELLDERGALVPTLEDVVRALDEILA